MERTALLLLLALASAARADYIQFRNGGKLEGVITGETATDITIKTGPGTATFKKSQLTSIYRDAPEANANKEKTWRSEDFSNPEFLPAALRPLATEFRALGAKRSAAYDARSKAEQLRKAATNDEAEYVRLLNRRTSIVLRPPDPKNHAEVAAYNKLVQTSNDLVTRMNEINQRREQLEAATRNARTSFSAYIAALNKARTGLETERPKHPSTGQAAIFFEKALQQIATYAAEMHETKIPVTDARRGHAVVTARFNDRHDAKLLVDTGASYVSLPIATATRLKLNWDEKNKSKATLANGSEIDVYPATIARLTVAGATLENVPAIIMPDATASDTDGLLGMSFLREFDIQIDSSGGGITLRRLPSSR